MGSFDTGRGRAIRPLVGDFKVTQINDTVPGHGDLPRKTAPL
jgi:hypothetical protein